MEILWKVRNYTLQILLLCPHLASNFSCCVVCVTILTNDDAHGEFSFDANSVSVVIEESGAIPTAANGMGFHASDHVCDAAHYVIITSQWLSCGWSEVVVLLGR